MITQTKLLLTVVIGLTIVLALALGVSRIGGVQVRTSGQLYQIGQLTPSATTLLPGQPVTLTLPVGSVSSDAGSSILLIRMPTHSVRVAEVSATQLSTGTFEVTLPCDGNLSANGSNQARLVLIDNVTQAVQAQSPAVNLLSDTRECYSN